MPNVLLSNVSTTWTNSGTAYNAIKMNVTDTASAAASKLIDLQTGGASRFNVDKVGNTTIASAATFSWSARAVITSPADGILRLTNAAFTDFTRLQFGGTTSAFPSLKRNGTVLQARLADDSGDAGFSAANVSTSTSTANTATIAASGYSVLGTDATPMIDLSGTWNTTGAPTALKINITDTASSASANIFDFQTSSTSRFRVDKLGNVVSTGYLFNSGGIVTEATTARTLTVADSGKVLYFTNTSSVTVTTANTLGAGFSFALIQANSGQITVSAGVNTTVNAFASSTKTAGQFAMATIFAPVANTFILGGNLV